jgi:POT family proton-dependent oligopeptide transporter
MGQEKHPPGLYVLFFTEMWERFGFYSMLAMFTLYLRNPDQGFGWTAEEATSLYSNYMMCVYASPLIGGWLADRGLGYRRSVLIGGVIFMIGYLLLTIHSLPMVYAALVCLVIGNGFFKPNVSAMVGQLYPEGSTLKDRAFNIFYMGINIGALLAPINAEIMVQFIGYNWAFAIAGIGMIVSVAILWSFKHYVEGVQREGEGRSPEAPGNTDSPPTAVPRHHPINDVSDAKRVGALIVIFLMVIVFWMVFHQNGSTLTYWANENTDWKVTGIVSNAINPFWVVTLTFPLVWLWQWLAAKGMEPSTPTKMTLGMLMTCLAFLVLYFAAKVGEATVAGDNPYQFVVSPAWLVGAYAVLTLGELMLSPMGLSLVSKVAPVRLRGVMMGGWFAATAVGNKLTQIGILWDKWLHSSFWILLSGLALVMAVVLMILLRPLKKAMPGV